MSATVHIVGRGPSLLRLSDGDFPDPHEPVICLNRSLLWIRKIGLPNPIYAMAKDGCIPHTFDSGPPEQDPEHVCSDRIVWPKLPETFVTSAAEGLYCQKDYPKRIVLNVTEEYGLPWHTMSLPVAVEFAYWMLGASEIRILAADSMVHGNTMTVQDDGSLVDSPHAGYYAAAARAKEIAGERGVHLLWA